MPRALIVGIFHQLVTYQVFSNHGPDLLSQGLHRLKQRKHENILSKPTISEALIFGV